MYCIQSSLFIITEIAFQYSKSLHAYQELFRILDLSAIPDREKQFGRKGYSMHAMIRALIVKHRERIGSIPRLIDHLDGNPVLAELCGFTPGVLPDATQFYRFLGRIKHSLLEQVLYALNQALIGKGVLKLDTFLMDSKPVLAATRDNNPKNPDRNLTDKEKKPLRNPAATLGYLAKAPGGGKEFFWGYRTHVIVSGEGIPLVEVTLPNDESDARVALTLIKKLKRGYRFKQGATFIGDASYDVNELYDFIIDQLKCHAFIPHNPRASKDPHIVGEHGRPVCPAGIEMASDGQWTDTRRNALKHKFRCPLKTSKTLAKQHPCGCPENNPKFTGYGCTKYVQESYSARASVRCDTESYQKIYAQRIAIEQYFSRLGTIEADQTTHYRLNTIRNQITIAHISQSLVALAAVSMNKQENIRCYRTFARTA
jgi:hypothetical protein